LIALLHRLGLTYRKPDIISRKLNVKTQMTFIEIYEKLLNSLPDNEAVVFVDAVHPNHAARPASCWALVSDMRAVRRGDPRIPTRKSAPKLVEVLQCHYR
jgi:hypothetical protein